MDNDAYLEGQDCVLEENTNDAIEKQEEAQDLVILANSDSSSSFISIEEELDPITRAIRQEILQKQRNVLREYIAENFDPPVDKYDDQEFSNYLKNSNNRVIIKQAFLDPKIKVELEKAEIEGYKKVHHNFADRFQAINWQDGQGQENVRAQIIKNDLGDQLAIIKETTHKASERVFLADGTGKQINSYRTIDFPTELESKSGPMHLSLVVRDENGRNIAKDKAVYFTVHYDRQGKLVEMSSPKPVKFNGEGDEAIGYIEHQGHIYTLPVTQGKYREMMLALEKNKGQEINLSQITDIAQDRVIISSKSNTSNIANIDLRQQTKIQYHQKEPSLFKVNKIKDKATMVYEVDQAMVRIEEAKQAWHKELKKTQTWAANLPEDNPSKKKFITFINLLLEQDEAIKTGKPLPYSVELEGALTIKDDYEVSNNNGINNNTSNSSAINHEQNLDNNFCQIKTNQIK